MSAPMQRGRLSHCRTAGLLAAALVLGHPSYERYSAMSVKNLLMRHARRLSALRDLSVTGGTLNIGFLEPAVTSIVTKEAYTQFRNVSISGNRTINRGRLHARGQYRQIDRNFHQFLCGGVFHP